MLDGTSWVIWCAGFAWLGFTCGYFYRKWLEVSFLPGYQAHNDAKTPGEEPTDQP